MRIARLAAVALVATVLAVLTSGPAWAHNVLTRAVPAKNATLDEAPAAVELTFLQKVDPNGLTITVTDARQQAVPAEAARAEGKTGSIAFRGSLGNGVYTVDYRVASLDGHAVQGSYRFTVDDPSVTPSPAPSAVAAAPETSAVPPAPVDEPVSAAAAPGGPGWRPAVAGMAVVVVLAAVALAAGRRHRSP